MWRMPRIAILVASISPLQVARPMTPPSGRSLLTARFSFAWKRKKSPAPLADDAEFLRRVYLDLHGVVPTLQQAREFLGSRQPQKRDELIDDLLASPRYGPSISPTCGAGDCFRRQ